MFIRVLNTPLNSTRPTWINLRWCAVVLNLQQKQSRLGVLERQFTRKGFYCKFFSNKFCYIFAVIILNNTPAFFNVPLQAKNVPFPGSEGGTHKNNRIRLKNRARNKVCSNFLIIFLEFMLRIQWKFYVNPWFLYDNGLCHERVKTPSRLRKSLKVMSFFIWKRSFYLCRGFWW